MLLRYLALIAGSIVLSSCSTVDGGTSQRNSQAAQAAPTLVGAWEVTAKRAVGAGKNMLTFSSDGTFFRSGDTHPALSGAHGAWKTIGPNTYEASYVAFTFDQTGKWNGFNRNNLRIVLGADGNEFTGNAKTSVRDLQENVKSTGTVPLEGKRIQVQPY
jgi:hypothetical protein